MFKDLPFFEASDLYQTIRRALPDMLALFGEAGVECIVDALHTYAVTGHAEECSGFDLDFCHLFTLAYSQYNGHDLKPEFSCLTDWVGMLWPCKEKHNGSDDKT